MTDTPKPSMDKIVERIQKILALGKRGGTEAESAAAMAKANALLAEHNLSMAEVESETVGSAKREKIAQAGGRYVYQRELWRAIARLNFCIYFSTRAWVKIEVYDKWEMVDGHWVGVRSRVLKEVLQRQHKVVGRVINTQATINMATYLEQVAERLCRERLTVKSGAGVVTQGNNNTQFYSSWAIGFREGVADRLIEKIEAKRERKLYAERQAARRAAAAGSSSSTALTLGSLIQKEEDENWDFLHGDELGTTASNRAEEAAERARADAEYTAWALANPEEAKRRSDEAKAEREKRQRRYRGGGGGGRQVNWSGYSEGQKAAEKVGIDPQAGKSKIAGRLR